MPDFSLADDLGVRDIWLLPQFDRNDCEVFVFRTNSGMDAVSVDGDAAESFYRKGLIAGSNDDLDATLIVRLLLERARRERRRGA